MSCTSCAGKGVATVWLELESRSRVETRTDGDTVFAGCPAADEVTANIDRIGAAAGTRDTLGAVALRILERPGLHVQLEPRTEREVHIEVQHEQSTAATVQYALSGKTGRLEIDGWSGDIRPSAEAMSPLHALRSWLWLAFTMGFCVSGVVALWFTSRHWYYASSPAAGWLASACVLLPLALWPLVIYRSRPSQNRRGAGTAVAMAPAVGVMICQAVLAASGPTPRRAYELALAGDVRRAIREAKASAELGIFSEDAKAVHDTLVLREFEKNEDPSTVWTELAAASFLTEAARRDAESHALHVSESRANALLRAGQYAAVIAYMANVPPAFRSATSLQERSARAQGQLVDQHWATVKGAGPFAEQVAACRALQAEASALGTALSDYAAVTAAQITTSCGKVDAEAQRRQRLAETAAAAAQARAAQAARAAELSAARRMRAWSSAPLQCNDGSLSPSCSCGGSHRGCCSHHGGVAGCSAR